MLMLKVLTQMDFLTVFLNEEIRLWFCPKIVIDNTLVLPFNKLLAPQVIEHRMKKTKGKDP